MTIIKNIHMTATACIDYQKFEYGCDVECRPDEIETIQKDINDLALQGLKDLLFKQKEAKK